MTDVAVPDYSEMATLSIFVLQNMFDMELFIEISLALMTAVLAVIQFVKTRKHPSLYGEKGKLASRILVSAFLVLIADVFADSPSSLYIILGMMLPLNCMCLLTSSIWKIERVRLPVHLMIFLECFLGVYRLLCLTGLFQMPSAVIMMILIACLMESMILQFVIGIALNIHSVKRVMKSGTIWANISISVDAVYVLSITMNLSAYFVFSAVCPSEYVLHSKIVPLISGLALLAYAMRILNDSLFVIWHKQERRIIESMKVTNVESAVDASRIDDVYKDLYERIISHFETERPYLDSKLTINDVVRSLYTNKLYISRSISQFTGRNFCQFVNYYRVMYSLECFRENPALKIHELASMSGFNSIVSYNMAFRLFMGENPSEWSRKEKSRQAKIKK